MFVGVIQGPRVLICQNQDVRDDLVEELLSRELALRELLYLRGSV